MQGSVYQKTDATREINVDCRNKYWADGEVDLPLTIKTVEQTMMPLGSTNSTSDIGEDVM